MKFFLSAVVVALATVLSAPAQAREATFNATLRGDTAPTTTGSPATGTARIVVDLDKKTVDLSLIVTGITIEGLWDPLVAQPMGPIHLHLYAMTDHDHGGDATLVMPVPFGDNFEASQNGFTVTMEDYAYATGAAVLGSQTTFEAFVQAMESGAVVLNIHTDKFNDGEISGPVVWTAR